MTEVLKGRKHDQVIWDRMFPGMISEGNVIPGSEESYLPTNYPESHCSFLEKIPNGDIICVWFSGKKEGVDLVSIILSYLSPNNDYWTEPVVIARTPGYSNQNPVLFYNPKEEVLYLWYSSQVAANDYFENQHTIKLYEMKLKLGDILEDDDMNKYTCWSAPQGLFGKDFVMGKGRVCYDDVNNTMLLPVYEKPNKYTSSHFSSCITISHGDIRNIYKKKKIPGTNKLVQGHIITFSGHIKIYFRDRFKKHIWYSESSNFGETWKSPKKINLPNNNCGICPFKCSVGGKDYVIMVFNNTNSGRRPLSIAYSEDGIKFKGTMNIEEKTEILSVDKRPPEYSYPNVLVDNDTIHISYTYNRWCIKYIRISNKDLARWLGIEIKTQSRKKENGKIIN